MCIRDRLDAVDDGSLWNPLALTLALCDHSDTEIRTRASTAYQTASKSYEKARIAAEDARQRDVYKRQHLLGLVRIRRREDEGRHGRDEGGFSRT